MKKDGKEQRIENQEHYIIKQEMIITPIEKTKRNYYNNALKNNKDPRMLNKNLDDLIGLKEEKVVTTWILQTNLRNFLMIKQIKYTGVLRTKISSDISNISFMPQQINKKLDRFQELNLTDLKKSD